MKILFDHQTPFLLAHGGFQIQIEQTKRALEEVGVTVEHLSWWDGNQTGDLIHFFGRPTGSYIDFAHTKGISVVIAELLSGLGSRSPQLLALQKWSVRFVRHNFPQPMWAKLGWDAYTKADRIIALTGAEAHLMEKIFGASAARIEVVPNGVDAVFFEVGAAQAVRGEYLVCTATITERKRVLELAQAAVAAQTRLWIVGKPYSEADLYGQRFMEFVQQHSEIIRYEGEVSDRATLAKIYRAARGFVLLSAKESLSLSALEAAACGCPLLLSDLPWARSFFGSNATYCPIADRESTASCLRNFYRVAPTASAGPKPPSWNEVAMKLKRIYEQTLSGDRAAGRSALQRDKK